MHEVIHWLRLMPYKLNKDRKRAAMFYAGLGHGRQRCGGFFGA